MTDPQSPAGGRRSLADVFAEVDEDDLDASFVRSILAGAARRDPELPDLLRACAIPRSFDAAVVGVLRDARDDDAGNRRLLEMVVRHPFVLPRENGNFVFHDVTRDAFLRDWETTEESRARFTEINQSLAAFHESNHAENERIGRLLGSVAAVMDKANPRRLARLRTMVETSVTTELLEAMYHHLSADPVDGVAFFRTTFYTLEVRSRLSICNSLVSAAKDFLRRLSGAHPELTAIVDYFQARVMPYTPPYDVTRAERQMRALIEGDYLPADLVTWAMGDLASIYTDRLDMTSALDMRVRAMDRAEGDAYNAPLRAYNLATLYAVLDQPTEAANYLDMAIAVAENNPEARQDIRALSKIGHSTLSRATGDWATAFAHTVEAFFFARQSLRSEPGSQQAVVLEMARLLSSFDPLASDCAAFEGIRYSENRSEGAEYAATNQIDWLRQSDRVGAARTVLNRLVEELRGDNPAIRAEVDLQEAQLANAEGRPLDASRTYSTLIERTRAEPSLSLTYLTSIANRGECRAQLGDHPGAIDDLQTAYQGFLDAGMPRIAGLMPTFIAMSQVKLGQVPDAEAALLQAAALQSPANAESTMNLLLCQGKLAEFLGDWAGAQQHYVEAQRVAALIRRRTEEVTLLGKSAATCQKQGKWALAAEQHRQASQLSEQIMQNHQLTPDGRAGGVAENNAEAMCRRAENTDYNPDHSEQLLRSAVATSPDNLWPWLNLAVVAAEQEDFEDATRAINRVLDLCPQQMRCLALYRFLKSNVTSRARFLLRRGNPKDAARTFGLARDRLADGLPAAELREFDALHYALLSLVADPAAPTAFLAAAGWSPDGAVAGTAEDIASVIDSVVETVEQYWAFDENLRLLQSFATGELHATVRKTRELLTRRLDELVAGGPTADSGQLQEFLPIIVEVGEDLVPLVDSRSDGGTFLYEMIPALRERVEAITGVRFPGIRMRSAYGLGPNDFVVHIDEVPVYRGEASPTGSYDVVACGSLVDDQRGELTDVHPLSGEPGLWLVYEQDGDGPVKGRLTISAAQYLLHCIERVIRDNLARFFGVQEVTTAIEDPFTDSLWAMATDPRSRLRFAWLLQSLIDEKVPVTDPLALLAAVSEAGGLLAPMDQLRAAARQHRVDQLPGPRTGKPAVAVPPELQVGLLTQPETKPPASRNSAQYEFFRWLRTQLTEMGPAITLVAQSEQARRIVFTLGRDEAPLLTTLCTNELR